MDFLPGAMIGGKYRLERKIAEGGVGEVWIAVDQKSRRVAIKRLLPDTAKDRELVARFRREALLLGKLQSEHVSQVIEQITDPKFGLLLVMEFVDGESLADLLDKRGRLPISEVLAIGIDIARAIGVLHDANIIHRDLKPENVILRRLSGGGNKAVLIDFGFARLDPSGQGKRPQDDALTGITRADTMLGTVAYMAPEQVLNSRDVGRGADIYALGAILYRAVTGRHVFGDLDDVGYARAKLEGEAPPLVIDRINAMAASSAKIIMRALKRKPADRFDTIETMLKELETVRKSPPTMDDADAPTQNAPISSLLGSDAVDIAKLQSKDGATSQTDRVVVNVPAPPLPDPAQAQAQAAASTDESSVTRPRQVGVQTIPMPHPTPLIQPPPPPPPLAQAPPALRIAPPPVPPKLPPATAPAPAPGVDDDAPAFLRNTGQNRAAMQTVPMAGLEDDVSARLRATAQNRAVIVPPGVDDEVPAQLRNTSRTRGLPTQSPMPLAAGPKRNTSGGISFGAAVASMLITLLAGFVAGWIIRSIVLGVSPSEMHQQTNSKH